MKVKTKNGKWVWTGKEMARTLEAKILLNYHNHAGDDTVESLMEVLSTMPPHARVSMFTNDRETEGMDYLVVDLYETRPPTPEELVKIERKARSEKRQAEERAAELALSAGVLNSFRQRTAKTMLAKIEAELLPVRTALDAVRTRIRCEGPSAESEEARVLLDQEVDRLNKSRKKYEKICNT